MNGLAHRMGPGAMALALALAAAAACWTLVGDPGLRLWAAPADPGVYDPAHMVLLYATLPRLAMALLCGAALSAAGAIMQQVLSNPLASPTTLGVDAGARLALTVASVFLPGLLGFGRDLVALAGSALALALVFGLSRGRAFSAINLVLAGLVTSLYCGAFSIIVTLVKDRYLAGLFVWGSGSLSLQSWQPVIDLTWRQLAAALPVLLLLRPLAMLELGDEASRARGVPVGRVRAAAIGIAVLMSALVTSTVGVIGFISLAAPLLARLAGARQFGARLLWSTLIGGFLLLLTDAMVQLLAGQASAFLPTGAVTAVLGSPLLLVLLPRLKFLAPPPAIVVMQARRKANRAWMAATVLAGLVLLVAIGLLVGRTPAGGWAIATAADWNVVEPWRLPRLLAAGAAGAMLSVAGFILQRVTRNPMASPEILGVSAGAILAVAISLFFFRTETVGAHYAIATLGGLGVLVLMLALSRRAGFAPERVLLAGVAISALIDAVVGVLSATADPNAIMLLAWLSGSTSGTSEGEAAYAVLTAAVLVAPTLLAARWLAILPLGAPQATAIGVPATRARLALFGMSALLTAAATPIVGPFTFVGLMAPHIVSALGVRLAAPGLLASAVVGASLLGTADLLARTIAFPILLPTGITAALVAGPFLLVLLRRNMGTA